MKIKYLLTYLLFATAITSNAQINFIEQPEWNDVLAKAKTENKFIFVDAYTTWCGWCKVMDKSTFKDSAVIAYMNKNFVCVRMEMETGFGCQLAMKYRVNSFPTYLVLSANGQYVDRTLGYREAPKFTPVLDKIISTPRNQYPTGISSTIELPFPDFYKKQFTKDKEGKKSYPDSATIATYLAQQTDLSNEIPWSVLSFSGVVMRQYYKWVLANIDHLRQLYGNSEVNDVLYMAIGTRFAQIKEQKNEVALTNEIFPLIDKYIPENGASQKAFYKIEFYGSLNNYVKEVEALKELADLPDPEHFSGNTINEISWDLYEKCDDNKALLSAATVMKQLTNVDPKWAYMDTYASLLYKLKDYKAAEIIASNAIDLGIKANEKVEPTQKLLEKIRLAKNGN